MKSRQETQTPLDRLLTEMIRDVFKAVQDNSQRASKDQKRHYDLRRRAWKPTL